MEVHVDALKRSVSVSSRNVNYHRCIIECTGRFGRLIRASETLPSAGINRAFISVKLEDSKVVGTDANANIRL